MTIFELCADLPNIQKHIICFRADAYSALFFSLFLPHIKKLAALQYKTIQTIDAEEASLDDIKRMISASFLGQSNYYWFKDISNDAQLSSKWQNLCAQYAGPHTLMFFAKTSAYKDGNALFVDLPETIDMQTYQKLFAFFFPEQVVDKSFFTTFFQKYASISLDHACLIMQYQTTMGRRFEQFMAEWASKIISPEHSLFTLSQHFFSQDDHAFFSLWNQCKSEYPEEFWIVFWSEQLWQAIVYVTAMQNSQEAKRLVNRLPFSFMNKDWKKYAVSFLVQSHHELYLIDYMLKNGNSKYGLELWYHKFFLNNF